MIATATTGRVLLDVAVVLVAAWAGGLLFARIGQPAVIGEIAAGIALGPTLLGALPGDPSEALFPADALEVLQRIGQVGLAAFMFTIGWDLDLRLVRRHESAAATVSIASILLPFLLGLGLATYLHPEHDTVAGDAVPFWPFALFIGTALSLTAFPVLARILRDTRMDATPVGVLALTAAAIDDVIGWSVLASRSPCWRRAAHGSTCASWPSARRSSPSCCWWYGRCCTGFCGIRRRRARRWCCRSPSPARTRRRRSASMRSSAPSSSASRCPGGRRGGAATACGRGRRPRSDLLRDVGDGSGRPGASIR